MNFYPYLSRVFFDMELYVMLLRVGEFRENQCSEKPYLNWGAGSENEFPSILAACIFRYETECNAVERWGVS